MSLVSSLKHSIFVRIYAGLLIVCLCVALFAQLLMETINKERVQSYRESMATGAFHIVSEGLAHQETASQREYWLSDASSLFGTTFSVLPIDKVDFNASELRRFEGGKTVVRYVSQPIYADVYYRLPDNKNVLTARISQVTEQQVRAIAVFLLDDLSYHVTLSDKRSRLAELEDKFTFPLEFKAVNTLDLDSDQMARLRRDEVVISLQDTNSSKSNSAIRVVVPSEINDMAILIGPVPLFNYFPLNLIISMILISMFLISLGVYALIFPLERKLQLIQVGVNEVSKGNLDSKVQVIGQDEIARLSATFNAMTSHIKRLIESQRELTRAVSHELRTPVARIRFAVDMLADTDDEDSRFMQRDYIDEDIESLNGLIDEILTYAKLEEGSPKLDLEPVNLKELIEQIVRETKALGKDIDIVGKLPSAKVTAIADRRYLHRVIQNLAGNALRYAETTIIISGGVKKGNAFVSVEDDGHGIPEEDREKVFIPFSRLDDSRTRASGGYGLGLSIVSRIAFWFNGSMKVDESRTLGGARFVMTWPIKPLTQILAADELTQEKSERDFDGK
ncbi:ATP-binding protein [Psychrobacter sp. AOP22-C1-22]|uniref:ATP-binding protein n=1 Tax=unclassified Psychrobacter TaxID=196806 RepID=UPI0017880A20|nr:MULTISPECIES: ATP-binding protein [unclassified Psychrobacter]MDN5801780.1 ATP-binding protein [Psychrobacter sp.]MBE0405940.1 HAMP domain-containing protein [Psychrobacter sp. FME6]MBE0444039.1 HAMP domain-containing protein [Psychrobacter sp. FME5]MDN5891411.1 ATP-binding protein [Psychrobacter sp.]MDN5897177.1 ATP-binding protein [Psychrobacter sp.]